MNQKDKNLKFKKSHYEDSNTTYLNPQNQRDKIKLKIMEKYNISAVEAEKILSRLEKKEQVVLNKSNNLEQDNSVKGSIKNFSSNKQDIKHSEAVDKYSLNNNSNNVNKNSLKYTFKSHQKVDVAKKLEQINKTQDSNSNEIIISNIPGDSRKKVFNNQVQNQSNNSESNNLDSNVSKNDTIKQKNSQNVDSILGEIVPNYNQQISIKLDHVDLTFEVQNEKIDTLKETFIRKLKRDKSKKIKIHALKDISFQIYKGEKVGIIGYNGAGKSTLLNVITGIYPPDNGDVFTYGKISPLLSLGAGFDHNFSGRKNIILNGAVLGYDKDYLESKIDEIIEFSELGEFIDIPIKNYSSGMLAKLGFSIATSVEPDILIIDEILGVGDVNFKKKSADKIRSLMDGGTTVLLVSHSIPQIRELCDKAIWVNEGSIKAIGEVNKVCDCYLKDAEKATNEQLANIQFR